MSKRDRLVRALANAERSEFETGLSLAKSYVSTLNPTQFRKLLSRFNPRRLRSIIEDDDHPDRASAVAEQLTGHASFLTLIDEDQTVDYRSRRFLDGFIAGVAEELGSIQAESSAILTKEREDEVDLADSYNRAMSKPDPGETFTPMSTRPVFPNRLSPSKN